MKIVASLDQLPVELIYRLIDYLDYETILLSFRYLSKKFYSIINNCNDYHLNLSSISKKNYDLIFSNLIFKEKIISIILSDENQTAGQIQLFLSHFKFSQFPRLDSLTIKNVDSKNLNEILNDIIDCSSLTSFSFYSRGKRNKFTYDLLSKLIQKLNIKRLSMNTNAHYIEGIFYSIKQSNLIDLNLGIITLNEYKILLENCPYLEKLIIDDCWINDIDQYSSIKSYHQLKYLTLKQTNRSIIQLEYILLLTKSIIKLKIINCPLTSNSLIDGFRWENFIKKNLLLLKLFEFIFDQLF